MSRSMIVRYPDTGAYQWNKTSGNPLKPGFRKILMFIGNNHGPKHPIGTTQAQNFIGRR